MNIFLLLGFLEREGSHLCNTTVFIDAHGDLTGRYQKRFANRRPALYKEPYAPQAPAETG